MASTGPTLLKGTQFTFRGATFKVDELLKDTSSFQECSSSTLPSYETYSIVKCASASTASTNTLPNRLCLRMLSVRAPDSRSSSTPRPIQETDQSENEDSSEYQNNNPNSECGDDSFDYDDDDNCADQLSREYSILKLINHHPYTLQCLGRCRVRDAVDEHMSHDCLIFEHMDSLDSLYDYFQTHRLTLPFSNLVHLSATVISAFVCFDAENIVWHDEVNLSNFSYFNSGACITSGFHHCEVQPLPQEEADEYLVATYNKNCAQIKQIVFAILTRNLNLIISEVPLISSNPAQSLAASVESCIEQELRTFIDSFENYNEIFADTTLVTLIDFIQFLAKSTPPAQFESQESINNNTLPEKASNTAILTQTQPISYESPRTGNLNHHQQKNNNKSIQLNTNSDEQQHSESPRTPTELPPSNSRYSTTSHTVTAFTDFVSIDIEMTEQQSHQSEEYVEYFNQNMHSSSLSNNRFRSKADRLREEESDVLDDEEEEETTANERTQKCKCAHASTIEIPAQKEKKFSKLKSKTITIDTTFSNTPTNPPMHQSHQTPAISLDTTISLQDNLLLLAGGDVEPEDRESLISDKIIVRLLVFLVILFIGVWIVFGFMYDFGVQKKKNNDLDALTSFKCVDSNCIKCDQFADECSICRDGFSLDKATLTCRNLCTDSNCQSCSKNNSECEVCAEGFVLRENVCVQKVTTCPVANCSKCATTNKCVQCNSGFELSTTDNTCVRKCVSSACLTCDVLDPRKCIKCTNTFMLNASHQCVPGMQFNPNNNYLKPKKANPHS